MQKKKGYIDDPFNRTQADAEPDNASLQAVDAALYGRVDAPAPGRQTAMAVDLNQITPDPAQPRKAIPSIVSKAAKQDNVPEWQAWHRIAEQLHGEPIDLIALLRGEAEAPDEPPTHEMVKKFLSLAGLAASIARDGQTNAITVVLVAGTTDQYEIETGERRWQAHKMLRDVLQDETFSKIKARVVSKASVWRQASENGQREELTAIGKARQLALLLMDWYREKGVTFQPYREMVQDGNSDRAFYAQVADGNTYKVPDGKSDIFLQAVGLSSKSHLANYRALLRLSDALWEEADEDDLKEFTIRERVLTEKNPERFTAVNLSPAVHPPMTVRNGDGPGTKPNPANTRVLYRGKEVEVYNYQARIGKPGLEYLIYHLDDSGLRTYTETVQSHQTDDLPHPERGMPTGGLNPARGIDYDRLTPPPYSAPKVSYDVIGQGAATQLKTGQRRQNNQGRVFEIISIAGNLASCCEINTRTGEPMKGAFNIDLPRLLNMPIVNKDDFSAAPAPEFNAEKAMQDILGEADEPHRAVDNPPSTNPDDEDAPPDWAARGKTILHKPSNTICRVEGVSWDVIENCWYVRVKSGEGEWADLRVSECIPAIEEAAAPVEPHPALNPHNALSVITEMQFKLDSAYAAAIELKMLDEAKQIRRMKVLTPKALDTFLIDKGEEGAYAELETMWRACDTVKVAIEETMNAVYHEAAEALRQKIAQKRGA